MSDLWNYVSQLIITVASLSAAGFWFWSSAVGLSDNQDTFIADLQCASRLSAYAATAAGFAAVAGAIRFIRKWNHPRFD
jgi:hypothetical protein